MLASIMRIVQCEQRGRSMGVSDGRRKSKPVAWRFPELGGSVQHSLSPIVADGGAVMELA